ncbi:PREDICTED: bromodomain-containing protein 9 [Tarenaya hassleriana]|uniref:bromodomain-containing protein 9 n=1 Tax=Tarenaya hassleriana TaxID=28532 RepID=UPI00053C0882|nr:PREDICTED: bromodomain-containing protein 9 [Tarenaya hassleriana]
MGEVAETMTKKKKKGRPSLLDLQKRALKQQQQQRNRDEQPEEHRSGFKNPNSSRRSTRRSSNPNGVSVDSSWIDGYDDVDIDEIDDDERREKKHRLLHGLNSHAHRHSPNSQSANLDDPGENPEKSVGRRKIGAGVHGSDDMGEKGSKATDITRGSPMESGPTTPLPDKKLLVFILDRLQKKDTYGVFSDPVDPEELPDYHDIIANPMDFSTVRKKLDSGAYCNLEQFERDVFLICTNAMEYNAPDTIYYRQARSIHEMAKKDFENLRRDSDDDEEPQPQPQPKVVKRGRPPGKSLKKQLDTSPIDRTTSEISAETALATAGDSSKQSGAYNLRKAPSSYRFRPADAAVRFSHNGIEPQSGGFSVDWENEFPASVVKAVNKYGMKHFNVDENRRDTYNQLLSTSLQESSVLTTLEDEPKQLIPVGLNTEYGYARSLARYAANLGPVAWKIATRRIKNVLPPGIEFGHGWVGENQAPEDPRQQISMSGMLSGDHSNRILSPTPSVSSSFGGGNRHSSHGFEDSTPTRAMNPETEFSAGNHTNPPSSSGPVIKPESNGLIRGFGGLNRMSGNEGMASGGGGSLPYGKKEFHRLPPDLNTRLVSPSSPPAGSNAQAAAAGSSQHPDLALQL